MKDNPYKNNGGARKGAGRKSKKVEQQIIERLGKDIGDDTVIEALKNLIIEGDYRAIQLYFNYKAGKPEDNLNINADIRGSIDFKSLFGKK